MNGRNSMKRRINLQFMMIAAIAIVITAICSMLLFYATFKQQIFDDLKSYMLLFEEYQDFSYDYDPEYVPYENEVRITLVDPNGVVLYDSIADEYTMENHLERPEIKQAIEQGEGTAIRVSDTMGNHSLYYAHKTANGNVLRAGRDSDIIYRMTRNTTLLVLGLSVVVLCACMILSRVLTKRLLAPIEKMASNLDGINQDNTYMEMMPYIRTIKEQHIDILDSAKMRQEFTANVSHELKTPLTAISGYAELIGSGMADEKDAARFANEIHRSSDRLLRLINDILKLSELDEDNQEFEVEPLNLYNMAQSCIDMMEIQAGKQEIDLQLEGVSCIIKGNKSLIDELLYNLCSNAIRYNNKGGKVVITVRPDGGKTLLSVKDTGIGISKEHQERIFERFYRVDKSRSKQSGGTGLGLAIVKHIVAQHGAEMTLESEVGVGTEIKILF